ncbi:MAG: amidohydrolase family protein, partial [Lachnospiraceae bacterium]|nr:amidohydrolase family protein [Lachnospiraceae bacterium]
CDYETAAAAFAEGADHVTHLYNAMTPYSHRAPGLFGAAADLCGAATGLSGAAADFYGAVTDLSGSVNHVSGSKRVYMELICDGIHLHPAAVRTAFRLFGEKQMILVSDTMRAAGMPDGAYTLGGLPVYVKGHEAALSDGTLAGSVTNLMDCMREAVRMGISLETAVRCASYQPALSIGVEDRCGVLAEGRAADLVWLGREKLDVKAVFIDGVTN